MNEFVSSVDIQINQNDKEMCDAEISYDEITEALMAMPKNKSAGTDGLTTEFYYKFYDCLRNILCNEYKTDCGNLKWSGKVSKIKSLLNMWTQRQMTIQGRVDVIFLLLMSRLWYSLFVTSMPDHVLKDIKTTCVNFVWNNGAHLVKYNTIIDQKCNGGLQLPDIESKMYAFRLKFLARFLDKKYEVLWKSTFRYFISNIFNMNLSEEILFMSLPENLKCIPNVYKEMFEGLDLIQDDTEFDLSTENIYDQPLFYNPNVLYGEKAIVEMIQNVTNHCDINNIVKRYNILKVILTKEWTETIYKNVHRRNVSRSVYITVIFKDKLSELSMGSTKELYLLLTSKLCQPPVCYKKWMKVFEIEDHDLCKVWNNVNFCWKPSILMDLDFIIVLLLIVNNYSVSDVCEKEVENITHIFLLCSELVEFHC
ncbi:unnamed protein product [Mytilus coruscus]|uniref:Reverse transcriptase domain-containing protein n=1 Tax=Mytilus coruscus TaxID=42192 RepID=A0A6J8B0J0_MYTCO|nr:unnamed protein product [Mytilus coruscus]